jgi:hypothetical protein
MNKSLDKKLRKQLETAVIKARNIAETAATQVLNRLSVGDNKAAEYLTDEQKKLRNRLRAHGRQLGDVLKGGEQETKHLVVEIAYEHWHRMLFSRFLEQNNLLMYDKHTPISLDDCQELSQETDSSLGTTDGWELAAKLASKMLPQIFRIDSPVFELKFAPEHQQELEKIIANLHTDTFQAQDSLGWVYQYWQTQKKEEVNKSGNKIGADELSAVTQLFTEPYMVSFLLDNSLGAWWVTNYPQYKDILPLEFLRYAPEQNDNEEAEYKETDIPAAGTFEGWPKNLSELKMLDPCCGSGHFLVATMLMLVPMRMKAEDLAADEAIDKVLTQSIHGLELDQRCVEIAAFAVALEAWRYPGCSGYRELPSMNIAWVGQSIKAKKDDWLSLAGDDARLYKGMEVLYDTFKDAPLLGSLIDPSKTVTEDLFHGGFNELQPLLNQALEQFEAEGNKEATIAAKGLTLAADLLSQKYELIVTNVPYLSRSKQCEKLQIYTEQNYFNAKNDIANVFLERCLELNTVNGVSQMVIPQNWLFLPSYKLQRKSLLQKVSWNLLARLGSGAFDTISGEVVNVILLSLTNISLDISQELVGIDTSSSKTVPEKADELKNNRLLSVDQKLQLQNPGIKISLEKLQIETTLSDYANVHYGSKPGQTTRVTRRFWEISNTLNKFWMLMESSPSLQNTLSGKTEVCYSLDTIKNFNIKEFGVRGSAAWGEFGIIISKMSKLPYSFYLGEFFDDNTCVITSTLEESIIAIFCAMIENKFQESVRLINQKVSVTKETLENTPFDLEYWTKIAQVNYPNGLPKPYSDDPTQWIFHGHPVKSESPLQVAIARLLGYRWPADIDTEMELSDEARELIKQSQTLSSHIDDDGIACLPPIRGEKAANERLEALLMDAYGSEWNTSLRNQLLEDAKCKGKSLDFWLREKFFEQHCKLFQNRPFIWQIWDGLKDGFSALVNYHQLNRQNLERLIYTYLGDWIRTQEHGVKEEIDGAVIRLQAAETLKTHLETILKGEAPYDIFVRWKPLNEQVIGWNPDINDGVRLNIRPFMTVPDVGKKDAGILRFRPNIHWKKDRSKDGESAPWYKLGLEYGESEGSRINDHHLSLKDKQQAIEDLE